MRNYRLFSYAQVASTMDVAHTLAREGKGDGTIILAESQSNARGRHGRSWESPSGNLFTTILLEVDPSLARYLSFLIAVCVVEGLVSLGVDEVTLKWPNDFLIHGKKCGGVLIEKSEHDLYAVGIGLNLLHAPLLQRTLFPPTSFQEHSYHLTPPQVIEALCPSLEKWESILKTQGFKAIQQKWLSTHLKPGSMMSIKLEKDSYTGHFSGLTKEGFLILDLEEGTQKTFATGDVFF